MAYKLKREREKGEREEEEARESARRKARREEDNDRMAREEHELKMQLQRRQLTLPDAPRTQEAASVPAGMELPVKVLHAIIGVHPSTIGLVYEGKLEPEDL